MPSRARSLSLLALLAGVTATSAWAAGASGDAWRPPGAFSAGRGMGPPVQRLQDYTVIEAPALLPDGSTTCGAKEGFFGTPGSAGSGRLAVAASWSGDCVDGLISGPGLLRVVRFREDGSAFDARWELGRAHEGWMTFGAQAAATPRPVQFTMWLPTAEFRRKYPQHVELVMGSYPDTDADDQPPEAPAEALEFLARFHPYIGYTEAEREAARLAAQRDDRSFGNRFRIAARKVIDPVGRALIALDQAAGQMMPEIEAYAAARQAQKASQEIVRIRSSTRPSELTMSQMEAIAEAETRRKVAQSVTDEYAWLQQEEQRIAAVDRALADEPRRSGEYTEGGIACLATASRRAYAGTPDTPYANHELTTRVNLCRNTVIGEFFCSVKFQGSDGTTDCGRTPDRELRYRDRAQPWQPKVDKDRSGYLAYCPAGSVPQPTSFVFRLDDGKLGYDYGCIWQ